jgi:hypothetical protein
VSISFPHPGIQVWKNQNNITILRLHYSADPEKTPEWAAAQKSGMTDPAMYQQEFEINFEAKQGSLLYHLTAEATLEGSFPIPADWTRYFALDPHQRNPHGMLWGAVDPWGDLWIYRELWPSKVCLRYDQGKLLGSKENIPEDDNLIRIRDYVETIKWLESIDNDLKCADGRAEAFHLKEPERIYKRIIDYSARGFKDSSDSEDQRSIQQRYEDWGQSAEINYPLYFDDAIKDVETGIETVNEWLRPRQVEGSNGQFVLKSRAHIFRDKCPELVHQLNSNRYQALTPLMAERSDPLSKPVAKRNHLTDCKKYMCMAEPRYVGPPRKHRNTWKPMYEGIAY